MYCVFTYFYLTKALPFFYTKRRVGVGIPIPRVLCTPQITGDFGPECVSGLFNCFIVFLWKAVLCRCVKGYLI